MLPDPAVPASLLAVLELVRGSFTTPTFRTFAALVTGLIAQTGRSTLSGGSGAPHLERVNAYLMRWMRKKYKRLGGRKKAQTAWNRGRRTAAPVLRPLGLDHSVRCGKPDLVRGVRCRVIVRTEVLVGSRA